MPFYLLDYGSIIFLGRKADKESGINRGSQSNIQLKKVLLACQFFTAGKFDSRQTYWMAAMEDTMFLIESYRANGQSLVHALRSKGYELRHFSKIADAWSQKVDYPILMIINAAAAHTSGIQILRKTRTHFNVPILLISGRESRRLPSEPGFDQLIPPFTIRKLNSRIKKLLPPKESSLIGFGNLSLVPERNQIMLDDHLITLTPIAFKLLTAFVNNPGQVLSRKQLMRDVWETDYVGDTRTLDTHVSWLRNAISKVHDGQSSIVTVRNVGYQFVHDPDFAQ